MGVDQNSPASASPVELPAHEVTVTAFSMARTEVTNQEYEEFVRETNYRPPGYWVNSKPLAGQEQWPVTNVSIEDANAFASWLSKRDGVTYRLPTEEEWEYAARDGNAQNLYPWGNNWVAGRANVGSESPQSVGSYPEGGNRWGVLDLVGNVWEWTSSRASLYPGYDVQTNISPEQRDWMVFRGGSFASQSTGERRASSLVRDWVATGTRHPTVGFRLVRTAP